MDYKVVITEDAEANLDAFIRYLLFEKKNRQAATAVLDDFEATKESLKRVAGSLKLCDNPRLNVLGYRCISLSQIPIFCPPRRSWRRLKWQRKRLQRKRNPGCSRQKIKQLYQGASAGSTIFL